MTQNYSMAVSGGTERTQAYFSLNFSDEKGQYQNDDNKIYSSNIRISHEIKKWLTVGLNSQLSYTYRNRAFADLEAALRMEPLGTLYDENGYLKVNPTVSSSNYNLLLNNKGNYRNNNQGYNIYFNPYIEIRPLKGLTILSRLSANLGYSRTNFFQGVNSYRFYNSGGKTGVTDDNVIARITQSHTYNYKWENVLTYNFKVAEDHDFTITGVTSWNHNQNEGTMQQETAITDNAYLWHNMGMNGASKSTITSGYTMSKGLGLVGRIAYSYLGKYLASVSVRHDGSSRLSDDYRWDTFPAFSLGWRISDEKFMESTRSWLDNLKIRFGYGVTGTANINPYSTISNLEQSTLAFSGNTETIYRFSRAYTNKALGWEKSYNTNLGLDAAFLGGRIDFTADYYWTKTKGVIWTRDLPITDGGYNSTTYYNMAQNICETKNRGLELALNTRNIKTRDFSWESNITFAANHEEITALTGGTANNITNGNYALSLGEPVNSFYNYKLNGVWQLGEEKDAAVFGMLPGDLKIDIPGLVREEEGSYYKVDETTGEKVYYNADNHYTISGNDYQTLGHSSPDWTLGFKNTLKWKNFDLSVFLYWRQGQMFRFNLLSDYDPTGVRNFPEYFDYWTADRGGNYFPGINSSRSIDSYTGYYSLGYVDGSYFKVKNITLGYTVPENILRKIGISSCRVYGTITNPIIIAKSDLLKDYDPEMSGGLDYPLTRQLVFGINVSF
jgi:TonB-linked SusC/RagA family outer membrane protein